MAYKENEIDLYTGKNQDTGKFNNYISELKKSAKEHFKNLKEASMDYITSFTDLYGYDDDYYDDEEEKEEEEEEKIEIEDPLVEHRKLRKKDNDENEGRNNSDLTIMNDEVSLRDKFNERNKKVTSNITMDRNSRAGRRQREQIMREKMALEAKKNHLNDDYMKEIHSNQDQYFKKAKKIGKNKEVKVIKEMSQDDRYGKLYKLLAESEYEAGYISKAEMYYKEVSLEGEDEAANMLRAIFLENMYFNPYIIKHILVIASHLPKTQCVNLELLPLTGLTCNNLEIVNLSLKCFESWKDDRYLIALNNLYNRITESWLKDNIAIVMNEIVSYSRQKFQSTI